MSSNVSVGLRLFDMYIDRRIVPISDDTLGIVVSYMIDIDLCGNIKWGGLREGIHIAYDNDDSDSEEYGYPVHEALSVEYIDTMFGNLDVSERSVMYHVEDGTFSECCYHNGKRHGKHRIYDDDGDLCEYTFYWEGLMHGTSYSYGGEYNEITMYNHGKKHGEHRISYHDGSSESMHYVDDMLTGLCTKKDAHGKIKVKQEYLNGLKHGLYESYNDRGVLVERSKYDNGLLHGLQEVWNNAGILVLRSNYEYDFIHGMHEIWHDDGKLHKRMSYNMDTLHGEFNEYRRDGTLFIQCNYVNGKIDGECYRFTIDGVREIIHLDSFA